MSSLWRRFNRSQDRKSPRPRQPVSHLQKLLHQLRHHRDAFWANREQQGREAKTGENFDMNSPKIIGMTNVFENTRNKSQGAPQFTARDLTIPGVEGTFEVALWGPKRARTGSEFFTIKVKAVQQQYAASPAPARQEAPPPSSGYANSNSWVGGDDDDAPF